MTPWTIYSPWNSLGQNTGVGSLSFLQGSSQSRDQIQVSASQADSLPAEPQGKPKNIGVGSLSLPQADSLPTELSGSPNRNVNFCLIQILSNFPEGDDSIPFGLILVHMTFLSVACVSFGHNLEPSLGLRFLSLI